MFVSAICVALLHSPISNAGSVEVSILSTPAPSIDTNTELFVSSTSEPVLCSMEVHLSSEGSVRAATPRLCPGPIVSSATDTLKSWRFLPPVSDGLAIAAVWPVSLVYESGVVVTPIPERDGFHLIHVPPYLVPRWEIDGVNARSPDLTPRCSLFFTIDEMGLPQNVEVQNCQEQQVQTALRKARRWGFELVGIYDSSRRFIMEISAEQ